MDEAVDRQNCSSGRRGRSTATLAHMRTHCSEHSFSCSSVVRCADWSSRGRCLKSNVEDLKLRSDVGALPSSLPSAPSNPPVVARCRSLA